MGKPRPFLNLILQSCLIFGFACILAAVFFLFRGQSFPLVPDSQYIQVKADSVLAVNGQQIHPVSYRQLNKLLSQGNAALIDVRSANAFSRGHIPGAVSIPLSDLYLNYDLIETLQAEYRIVITYCDSPDCMESLSVAYELQMFFPEIYYYVGGWNEYKSR